ncbi:MAG TPA: DJ-1/PfpI family protein [Puia sp.]|nr:DJ-1/PfpI family protein [Puia sp.]
MKKILVLLTLALLSANFAFSQKKALEDSVVFVCPPCGGGCDEVAFAKAGTCPHCGMELVRKTFKDFNEKKTSPNMSICFYLQNGVEVLDFAGPLEVFTAAGFKVFIVSKTKEKIVAQGTLTIVPDYSIEDAPPADIMVFFGGSTDAPSNDPALISWIQSRKKSTEYFLSVCTGAFIIGRAGLLDNLTATTFHSQIGSLRKMLPKTKVLSNVRFVDNGNIITTAGISAGIDGALHLVEKLKGREFAKNIAAVIEYDKWVPENGLIVKSK